MLILAIDTTGFIASISLVRDGRQVLFLKNSSGYLPIKKWEEFPYILPDHHQEFLLQNIEKSLIRHHISWKQIDAVAVSALSGIYNCILVGKAIAYSLARIYSKQVIEVDHILAHNYSTWLEQRPKSFNFPILVFSASGSHSDFFLIKDINQSQSLSRDVAIKDFGGVQTFIGVGKIFRALGKSLGLIRPNDKTASMERTIKAMNKGNAFKFGFTKYYKGELLNLNFFNYLESINKFIKQKRRLSPKLVNNIAASFQESITEILAQKIFKLAKMKKVKEIHIAGGISENKYLEKKLKQGIKKQKLPLILRYPAKKQYRLDNAAMIGCLAYYQKKYKIKFKNFKPNITK